MMFTSTNYCSDVTDGGEMLFEHDRGTDLIIIKNVLINTPVIAQQRAIAEFLKGGYVEKKVTITSIHIKNLKQNDIISFKGVNWIVKEVSLSFSTPKLIQVIKGIRYE